jgi:hypothetical protein|tara:strand:+ start:856 stop:966 length:111 start_codon:yes stop_codon:yes gene_type:complete
MATNGNGNGLMGTIIGLASLFVVFWVIGRGLKLGGK